MPLANIIDERDRRYRFNTVLAIVEPTRHDNGCADADQVDRSESDDFLYAERHSISVSDAVQWANSFKRPAGSPG